MLIEDKTQVASSVGETAGQSSRPLGFETRSPS
jgi:hypothetical protein